MLQDVNVTPSKADPLFWADFVELRALIHPDWCFSRGDLAGLQQRNRDLGWGGFDVENRWRDISDFAGVRRLEFGDSYPFCVSDDEDTLTFEWDGRPSQRAYLALLISACLRHIEDGRRGEITRAFEETSLSVFSRLMPSGSEIHATWAHGGMAAPYQGSLHAKMLQLANDLRCKPNFEARDFKANDSGDGGIDIVAWHPMADGRDSMPIAFAQCGCSKDEWRAKQLEASPAKHYRHFPVMHPWATYYFLPQDLRWSDGDWAYKSDIGQAIIVDRLRLLKLAEQYGLFPDFPATPFVDEVMALRIQ
jgi:hypothetical protein